MASRSACIVGATATAAALNLALPVSAAHARLTPSTAPVVQIGSPFGGTQDSDLWRLAAAIEPQQVIQIAVDNTRTPGSLRVCLMGPVDDFDYEAEKKAACRSGQPNWDSVPEGTSKRLQLTYTRAVGQPLLWFSNAFGRENYLATIEQVSSPTFTPPPPAQPPVAPSPTPPASSPSKPFVRYKVSMTSRRVGRVITGRIRSRGSFCRGGMVPVSLRRVGSRYAVSTVHSRSDSTYRIRLPRRKGRYYVAIKQTSYSSDNSGCTSARTKAYRVR